MSPQPSPQPVYERTRQKTPAPKTDFVQDILRRALSESQKCFTEGANLRSAGNDEAGARMYIRAIGKLEAAAQLSLEILERRTA